MKILAIGDFHGSFPDKLKKEAVKSDVIISAGDFANADKIRKIIFKQWAGKRWYEAISLKEAAKLEKESYDSGLNIIRELGKIGKKVYFVWGNTDFHEDYVSSEPDEIMPGFYNPKVRKMKNMIVVDRRKTRLKDLEIIGHGGYVDVTEFIKHPIDKEKEKQKKRLKRYKDTEKELYTLFRKKKPKNFIFLTHYTPLNCLDKVKFKGSPMNGKNVGFEPYNNVIKKYKPLIVICGHMHENQGKCKIGRTIVVNPGEAHKGQAAIIEINDKKIESIKFIK